MPKLSPTELKSLLLINKHALDDEIIRQSQLYSDISDYAVQAEAERDAAKEDLEVVDAKLDIKWRKKLKDEKSTETMFKNLVKTDPEHEKAFDVWLAAKSNADEMNNLKNSFLQRSNMLRTLGQLYTSNYWMESSIKPTHAQENAHYTANRQRIATARAARVRPEN